MTYQCNDYEKKIDSKSFSDARELIQVLGDLLDVVVSIEGSRYGVYVYSGGGLNSTDGVAWLIELTLTDGSKVYNIELTDVA